MTAHAGAHLFGLSKKRAGNSHIEATGHAGAANESPVTSGAAGFASAGDRRKGATKYPSYPGEPGANAAHKGGVGTGQGKGSHG